MITLQSAGFNKRLYPLDDYYFLCIIVSIGIGTI